MLVGSDAFNSRRRAICVGATFVHRREITRADIAAFAALSEDRGAHHISAETGGPPMAHGLLTACIPTKIGGDLDFVSSDMSLRFEKPVFAGDVIEATVVIARADAPARGRRRIAMDVVCRNQSGVVVLRGKGSGYVPDSATVTHSAGANSL